MNDEQNNSVSPMSKSRKTVITVVAVVLLVFGSFRYGMHLGAKGYKYEPKQFKIVNQQDAPATADYSLLWQAIDTVKREYIEKDQINDLKILYGAVKGAVSAVGDQYTEFFTPEDLNNFKTELSGSFEGIGAEIGKRDGNIVIIAPLKDSPAEKAGLRAKDVIIKIDDTNTQGMSVDDVVSKIRGPKGAPVVLTIFREDRTTPFEVRIVRETIELKSVELSFKNNAQNQNIAIITLSRFGDDTKGAFDKAVNQVLSSGAQGLVVDLRNDPGGYLATAVDVASNWVPKDKLIVNEAHSDGKNIPYNSYGYGRLANVKTVVLINGGSASAAEILAGALQDYKLARLVGEKSFGKGSVQELVELANGSAVKITVAKWITPGGKNLNKDGLQPDIEVKLTEEDATAQRDPQMDKALEEVTK